MRQFWEHVRCHDTRIVSGKSFITLAQRPSWLFALFASFSCIALVAAQSTTAEALMDGNRMIAADLGAPKPTQRVQYPVVKALDSVYRPIIAITPPLMLFAAFACSAWILTRDKRPFKQQKFLWLMTLTASISWLVLAATPDGPNDDGKSISISTWLALIATCGSRNHRGLCNGNWHILASILGGLVITVLLAALTDVRSMEAFVQHALTVGPSVLTAWSFLAAHGQRHFESSAHAADRDNFELV